MPAVVTGRTGAVRRFVATHPWWHTALLVIGFISLITVLAVSFLGVDGRPRVVTTSEPVPPVDSDQFITALAHLANAPIEQGGTVEVLNNGDAFLPALLEGIDGARATINFLVYIWEDGDFSDQVLEALIRRQQDGVAVRLLLDGLGARTAPQEMLGRLSDAGGRVERFRTPRFGTWTRFHRRNHRRSITIDGEVGFAGGMAVGDKWLGNARNPDEWRDMMFRVTGPLARSLQAAFVHSWVSTSGEVLIGPTMFPTPAVPSGGVDRFIHLVNSPADDDQSMAYFYLLSILAARQKLYVATPYFIPDRPLRAALEDRARSGVDVRLLLPGEHIDNPTVRYSSQGHYDDLIEAGVRIFEYGPTFMHSKFVVVDGRWSIVGSPNLNTRSRRLDEENAFGILDLEFARRLEVEFLGDLEQSNEIRLDTWRRRGPLVRLTQLVARVLDQQS